MLIIFIMFISEESEDVQETPQCPDGYKTDPRSELLCSLWAQYQVRWVGRWRDWILIWWRFSGSAAEPGSSWSDDDHGLSLRQMSSPHRPHRHCLQVMSEPFTLLRKSPIELRLKRKDDVTGKQKNSTLFFSILEPPWLQISRDEKIRFYRKWK